MKFFDKFLKAIGFEDEDEKEEKQEIKQKEETEKKKENKQGKKKKNFFQDKLSSKRRIVQQFAKKKFINTSQIQRLLSHKKALFRQRDDYFSAEKVLIY